MIAQPLTLAQCAGTVAGSAGLSVADLMVIDSLEPETRAVVERFIESRRAAAILALEAQLDDIGNALELARDYIRSANGEV